MLFAAPLPGAEPLQGAVAKLKPIPPCAALVALAQTNQIPLDQIDAVAEGGELAVGDSATMLVTLCEKGGRRTQWLIYLQVVPPTADEQSAKPPSPMVIYSSCGTKLEYQSSPSFVSLRTLGPFAASETRRKPPKPHDSTARFGLNQGFLGIGLDKSAAAIMRLHQTGTHGAFWFGNNQPSEAEVSKSRKLAEAVRLTPEEERALGGSMPALLSYITIVQQTRGLNDILFKIVDMPSLWSIVRRAGVTADLSFQPEHIALVNIENWSVPGDSPAYHLPLLLKLNNQNALNITLVVTRPQPPLLACGGVIGLLAERPGDDETYLTLRVVSARCSLNKPKSH